MDISIRTLIVDDEPLARQGLRLRLEREHDVDIVGEAEDGPSAVTAILDHRPDLLFLDVQMPGFDGFEVLQRTASLHLPSVVFVTAYDRYALKAFVAHALDYLLKPIAHRRFQEALRRVREDLEKTQKAEAAERLRAMLDERELMIQRTSATPVARDPSTQPYATRLTVRDGDGFVLLKAQDIDWVEAAANYLKLHAGTKTFVLRMTMAEIERRLDPGLFARIHRSAIVNLDRVRTITPDWHGEFDVTLTTGRVLRLSRRYRDRLL